MAETATAPPPAAPASTSAPASTQAPSAPAKPQSSSPGGKAPSPAKSLADAYSQLDEMVGEPPPPRDPPAPPGKTAQEGNDKPGSTEGDEGAETETTEGEDTKPEEQPKTPEKKGQLRPLYDKLKADYAKLEAKVKELESKPAQPADDPEKTKLTQTLEAREKRLKELEDEFRFSNYERSTEYKEKFEQPFLDAYGAGRAKVASLNLTDAEGNARKGTAEDFDSFMRITDDDQAANVAAELFGTKAPMVMYHREKVMELNAARNKALDTYRKEGTAREQARTEAAQKHQKEMAGLWQKESHGAVEKYPRLFKPIDGDEKGNELLQRGFERADAAFGSPLKDADGKPVRLSGADLVKLHAEIRNKAGGFDRAIHLLAKERARVKELETRLKEYEDSGPGGSDKGRKSKKVQSTWDAVDESLRSFAK